MAWAGSACAHRYRFTLAHEVGHWFLHEPLYAPAAFENFEDWKQYLSGLSDPDQLPHCEYLSEKVARGFVVSGQCILKRGYYERLWSHRRGT